MIEKRKNKGGAPRGNQNARKHGLYSKVLTLDQQKALPDAIALDGIDREIGIVRLKACPERSRRTGSILANDPTKTHALRVSASLLNRLLRTKGILKTRMEKQQADALPLAISNHLTRLFQENNLRSD